MKYGEQKTIEITQVDKKGRGCGLVNDRPACAFFCIPGETIKATFVGRQKGIKKFEIIEIAKLSPNRVEPTCKHAGQCGGCAWQHIEYSYQLELKKNLLNKALNQGEIEYKIESVSPCPKQFRYRNRMDFCVGDRGEVGLKKPGRWNQYVDLSECHLISEKAERILNEFKLWLMENKIEPWNVFRQTGYARYCVIREGVNTGELMVTIVTSAGALPAQEDLLRRIKPLATTIYHGINPEVTDLSLAPQLELLFGPAELTEQIGDKKYFIPPNSFFQTNSIMAEKLLETVRKFVLETDTRKILDLYCGGGFFAIGLAEAVKEIYGVELDDSAIIAANKSAKLNDITNITFESAAVESLVWKNFEPDTVIIDPPRAGLHPKVIQTLSNKKPNRLIYVSCNYESFVRDYQLLKETYDISTATALDLFPNSPHLELVVLLKLKNDKA